MSTNVLIITRNGDIYKPIIINDNKNAQIQFELLVRKFVHEDDIHLLNLGTNTQLDDVNLYLNKFGISIHWFTDIINNNEKEISNISII